MASQAVNPGATASAPANPTRAGYTFDGWYTAPSGGTKYNFSSAVTSNFTLYAHWTLNTYTVTFDATGGSGGTTKTVSHGSAVAAPANLTKTGYTFDGWYTAASGGSKYNFSSAVTSGFTLYAHWTIITYTITFNANGGSSDSTKSVNHGSAVSAPSNPTRANYTFDGWYTAPSGGTKYNFSSAVTSNFTLYAHWTLNTYTVTFDATGGSGGTTKTVSHGSAVAAPANPTKTGYTFDGWYTAASGGSKYNFSSAVTSGFTLYAHWTLKTYTVTFDATGGSGGTTKTVSHGSAVAAPANPTKTGYLFEGWYTAASGGSQYNFNSGVTSSFTLYARWTLCAYPLTYVSDGATQKTASVPYGSLLNESYGPPSVSKKGHTFQSWNQPNGSAWNFSSGTMPASALTLTASWKANTYTVAFNANGGSGAGMADQAMTYGTAANLSQCGFSRTGYAFKGWSADPNATAATYANGAQVKDLSEVQGARVNLYAVWEANEYTVVFHANHQGDSSTATQSFKYSETTKTLTPNAFSRTGWTFDKWNTKADGSGASYADKALVSSPLATEGQFHLYAQWTLNSYDVTFDSNGGSDVASQTVGYGMLAKDPGAPSRPGYAFWGWYRNAELTGAAWNFASDTVPVGGVALYAKWTANRFTVTLDPGTGTGVLATRSYTYAAADQNLPSASSLGFSKTGYEFAGWTVAEDGSGTVYADGVDVATGLSTGAPVTLHAQWSANSYTVKFDAGEGSLGGVPVQMAATFDQDVTLPGAEPSRRGYTFLGWSSTAGAAAAQYASGQVLAKPNLTSEPGGTATLHAVWKANTYAVKFDPNATAEQGLSGGPMSDQEFTYDADPKALSANAYKRTGYTFRGWTENADGTGTLHPNGNQVKNLAESGTVTLYAKWEANPYFAVFFANQPSPDATVETTGAMTQSFVYDAKTNLQPTPFSCSGYEFAGWNTAADGSGTSYADGAEVLNLTSVYSGMVSLYAQWKGSAYTVTFDKNALDATGEMEDLELNWGVRADLPKGAFSRGDGWVFAGWSTEPDGTGDLYADGESVRDLPRAGHSEVTLYARWTPVINVTAPVRPVLKVTADGMTGEWMSANATEAAFSSRTPVALRVASVKCDPAEAGAPLVFPDRASWSRVALSMDAGNGNSVSIALGNDLIFGSSPSFVIGAATGEAPGTLSVRFGLTAEAGTPIGMQDEAVPLAHLSYTFEPIKETL